MTIVLNMKNLSIQKKHCCHKLLVLSNRKYQIIKEKANSRFKKSLEIQENSFKMIFKNKQNILIVHYNNNNYRTIK